MIIKSKNQKLNVFEQSFGDYNIVKVVQGNYSEQLNYSMIYE